MYKLPAAGPSFLLHLLVVIAALVAWPILVAIKRRALEEEY
jgi:hypothetical protein